MAEQCSDPNEFIVLAGYFNVVASNELDIISGNPHHVVSVDMYNDCVLKTGLFDVWRLFHQNEKEYTWCKQNPFIARRLDYIIVNSSMFDNISSCDIISLPGTDHRGVICQLQLGGVKRGPSYWKFNEHLLEDSDYVNALKYFINTLTGVYEGFEVQISWELIKIKIREMTIAYSKNKAHRNKKQLANMHKKLDQISKQISQDPTNKNLQTLLNETKLKIDIAHLCYSKGAQVRSREKWIEQGEKINKYFFRTREIKILSQNYDNINNK